MNDFKKAEVDPGAAAIAKYREKDDQTTPGEDHPEDETTGGAGRFRTVVDPNPKCLGCLHYDNTRSHCMVALYPSSCGDGSKPETGYAPLVPNEEAYQEWRAKRGLQHNAPRTQVQAEGTRSSAGNKGPVGGDGSSPDFVVQVLGDEGYVELSEKAGDLSKAGYEKCMKCGYKLMKAGGPCPRCKYKSLRSTVAFDDQQQADRVGGPVNKGQDWTPSARPKKVASTFKREGAKLTPGKMKPMPKLPPLGKLPRLNKAGMKDPWAVATAAWQKVSSGKKAKYTKMAMARHRRSGEKIHPSKYAKRAPREFMERIARKGGLSLVEEFGHALAGVLFKARYEIRKAATALTQPIPKLRKPLASAGQSVGHGTEVKPGTVSMKRPAATGGQAQAPSTPKMASPVLAAVRRRQMENPTPQAQAKARQAGGGKLFSHTSLSRVAGVKPEAIADLAHGSQHVHDFHNKVRQAYGDKVKHITSGQIRSAYHSTGLMHSMQHYVEKGKAGLGGKGLKTKKPGKHSAPGSSFKPFGGTPKYSKKQIDAYRSKRGMKPMYEKSATALLASDLDLIKAHKLGKRHVIGHTSTGKPVHSDAHGAEDLNHEEHREAGQMHDDIAQRLSDAAYGYGSMGNKGKLPPAAFKYMQSCAHHHRTIADRHHKTASLNDPHSISMPKPTEPFGKSFASGWKTAGTAFMGKEKMNVTSHGTYDVSSEGGKHHLAYTPKVGEHGQGKTVKLGTFQKFSAAHQQAGQHHMKMTSAKKSEGVRLSNNPTDAEVAKAMTAGGGAGALVQGGLVLSPLNVEPAEAFRHTMELGLPTTGRLVEIQEEPKKEEPPKFKPIVGGVPSSAWDLGQKW